MGPLRGEVERRDTSPGSGTGWTCISPPAVHRQGKKGVRGALQEEKFISSVSGLQEHRSGSSSCRPWADLSCCHGVAEVAQGRVHPLMLTPATGFAPARFPMPFQSTRSLSKMHPHSRNRQSTASASSLQHVLNGTLCCIASSQPSSPHLVRSLQAELCSRKACLFTVTSGPDSAAETTHGSAGYGPLTQVRRKRQPPHTLREQNVLEEWMLWLQLSNVALWNYSDLK